MPEKNSLKSKIVRQKHWLSGGFVVLAGAFVKCRIATEFDGNAAFVLSIAGTVLCLTGLFLIAAGIGRLHAKDDENTNGD